jgi:hypothetical protein
MSKIKLREKAIQLRLSGQTYSQIRRDLRVSKSTLSKWLSKLPLTIDQQDLVSQSQSRAKEVAVERYRSTVQNRRQNRLKEVFDKQIKKLLPLSEKELFLAGLFLYWGEGEKTHGRVSISNTDPRIVKFSLYWMVKILKIPKNRIKVQLHLYKDMDPKESIIFWSEALELPQGQFYKPYIKKTNREGLTYKSFGHGTCKLYHGNVELSEKVAMSIKAISDKYGAKSELFWYN